MPLYEYACAACGARFELLQRVGEGAATVACPRCANGAVERQLSTFAAGAGGRKSNASAEAVGCGRPQCAGGSCAGDWN
jgi:putative FmdB family regulatory protein